MTMRAREIKRDEELPIIKKSVSFSNLSIMTPMKGVKSANLKKYDKDDRKGSGCMINEISKHIDSDTLDGIYGTEGFSLGICRDIKERYSPDSVNFVFFNLKGTKFPNENLTNSLGHVLYSASDKVVCLPSIQKAFLLSPSTSGKSQKIDERKIDDYLIFQKRIIDAVNVRNSKEILGIIPLLVPKYTRKIVDLYIENEIFNYVIDAGTANILNKEPDLRSILGHISRQAKEHKRSLAETYIHAINLGINQFSADEVSADDFLSLFAYIDTFGTTFKTRGNFVKNAKPRSKVFLPDRYTYRLTDKMPKDDLPEDIKTGAYPKLSLFNEKRQVAEAVNVREMIGQEGMKSYVKSKAISDVTYGKLANIFSRVKVD